MAGATGDWCFGDDEARLGEYAWYDANSGGEAHAVGLKKPNAWGLFDMHGNVWEWCADPITDDGSGAPEGGPAAAGAAPPRRVARGGSWYNNGPWCGSYVHTGSLPADFTGSAVGFRPAADLPAG